MSSESRRPRVESLLAWLPQPENGVSLIHEIKYSGETMWCDMGSIWWDFLFIFNCASIICYELNCMPHPKLINWILNTPICQKTTLIGDRVTDDVVRHAVVWSYGRGWAPEPVWLVSLREWFGHRYTETRLQCDNEGGGELRTAKTGSQPAEAAEGLRTWSSLPALEWTNRLHWHLYLDL